MSGQADLSMEASKLEYMTHEELIRMFILDVISDDYEEIEKIEGETKKLADHAGARTNSAEIRGALIELIEMGLARAYRLSSTLPAQEVKGTPAPGEISGYYFWT